MSVSAVWHSQFKAWFAYRPVRITGTNRWAWLSIVERQTVCGRVGAHDVAQTVYRHRAPRESRTEPLWLSVAGAVGALVILPTLFVLAMVALGVKS